MFYSAKRFFCITSCLITAFVLNAEHYEDNISLVPDNEQAKASNTLDLVSYEDENSQDFSVDLNDQDITNKFNSALSNAFDKFFAKFLNNINGTQTDDAQQRISLRKNKQIIEQKFNAIIKAVAENQKNIEDLRNYLLDNQDLTLVNPTNIDNQKAIDNFKKQYFKMCEKLIKQYLKKIILLNKNKKDISLKRDSYSFDVTPLEENVNNDHPRLEDSTLEENVNNDHLRLEDSPLEDQDTEENSDDLVNNSKSLIIKGLKLAPKPEEAISENDALRRMKNIADLLKDAQTNAAIKILAKNASEVIEEQLEKLLEIDKSEKDEKQIKELTEKALNTAISAYNYLIDGAEGYNFKKLKYEDLQNTILEHQQQQNIQGSVDSIKTKTFDQNIDKEIVDFKEELQEFNTNLEKHFADYQNADNSFDFMQKTLKNIISEKEDNSLTKKMLQQNVNYISKSREVFSTAANRKQKRKIFFAAVNRFNLMVRAQYPNDSSKVESLILHQKETQDTE